MSDLTLIEKREVAEPRGEGIDEDNQTRPGGRCGGRGPMTKQERDLFRLRKEVELLVAQLDHIAEYVPSVEWNGEQIEFRELCQRALSRYQLERQREIQETHEWRLRDFVSSYFTYKRDSDNE